MGTEWSDNKNWNPFNSQKLFSHLPRWQKIQRGKSLPPPATISIDPTNVCNLACNHCIAQYIRDDNSNRLSTELMTSLGKELSGWDVMAYRSDMRKYPVLASCIGGGGEPTLHKDLDALIDGLTSFDILAGMVSNGVTLDRHDNLNQLTWLGVSVDAGTRETYEKNKGKDRFDTVIHNIEQVVRNSELPRSTLGLSGQGHGVSYKFLLQPMNIREVYEAAQIAKGLGCRNLHIRPVTNPFDRDLGIKFSEEDLKEFRRQLDKARGLEDDTFGVFGVTHKFSGDFKPNNDFPSCYGVLMTCAISPPRKADYQFSVNLCCDRRGDDKLTYDFKDFAELKQFWGSDEHFSLVDKIDPKKCNRCTLAPHNRLYQNTILTDNTTWEFM